MVDDDQSFGEMMVKFLAELNYAPVHFIGGVEALKHLNDNPVNLMILDIRMPGMDGLEVIRQAQLINAGLPIIVVSGFLTQPVIDDMTRLNVADYFTKPVQLSDLRDRVAFKLACTMLSRGFPDR